jgi:hypothetical protein
LFSVGFSLFSVVGFPSALSTGDFADGLPLKRLLVLWDFDCGLDFEKGVLFPDFFVFITSRIYLCKDMLNIGKVVKYYQSKNKSKLN